MSFTKWSGKLLFAAALITALASMSTGVMATPLFPEFQVTETVVPLAGSNVFSANKFIGNYNEIVSFTSPTTFLVSLQFQAAQYVEVPTVGSNTFPLTQLSGSPSFSSGDYQMYALYLGAGTVSTIGGVTTFTTTPGSGSLSLFLDPSTNTTFTAPTTGATNYVAAGNGEDLLVGTGIPQAGSGTLTPCAGINCGSFGTSASFALTDFGSTYFTAPIPFYGLSLQSGQFINFPLSGDQAVSGSMDVVFAPIPEPATLSLLGLGLLGVTFLRRKK